MFKCGLDYKVRPGLLRGWGGKRRKKLEQVSKYTLYRICKVSLFRNCLAYYKLFISYSVGIDRWKSYLDHKRKSVS